MQGSTNSHPWLHAADVPNDSGGFGPDADMHISGQRTRALASSRVSLHVPEIPLIASLPTVDEGQRLRQSSGALEVTIAGKMVDVKKGRGCLAAASDII
jgi:hypothetical protein